MKNNLYLIFKYTTITHYSITIKTFENLMYWIDNKFDSQLMTIFIQ